MTPGIVHGLNGPIQTALGVVAVQVEHCLRRGRELDSANSRSVRAHVQAVDKTRDEVLQNLIVTFILILDAPRVVYQ